MKLSTKIDRVIMKDQILQATSDYAFRYAKNPASDIEDNHATLSKKLNEILKIKWEG